MLSTFQVFLDVSEKEMKPIRALSREVFLLSISILASKHTGTREPVRDSLVGVVFIVAY
jgi:hypothetical protein